MAFNERANTGVFFGQGGDTLYVGRDGRILKTSAVLTPNVEEDITAHISIINTGTGIYRLPRAEEGREVVVLNRSTLEKEVKPWDGEKINSLAASGSYMVPSGYTVFHAVSATQWYTSTP